MPDLSPDGEWLVYGTLGGKEGDLLVVRTDGTGLRQLTKDPSKNRRPRWSPDGKRIAFESDRGGKFGIWIINVDGSGLRKINSSVDLNMVEAFWSPDGTRLAFRAQDSGATFIAELGTGPNDQPVTLTEIPNSADEEYRAHSWSPDGRKLAGWSYRRTGNGTVKDPEHKLCIYSFDTHRFEKLDTFGLAPIWLGDGRKLMFTYKGTVFLMDTTSKKIEKISTIDASGGFSVSPDGQRVFVSSAVYESDIWMMNLN
jgi:Tol biopolymer transport system component